MKKIIILQQKKRSWIKRCIFTFKKWTFPFFLFFVASGIWALFFKKEPVPIVYDIEIKAQNVINFENAEIKLSYWEGEPVPFRKLPIKIPIPLPDSKNIIEEIKKKIKEENKTEEEIKPGDDENKKPENKEEWE
jgi:hypothetical protein